MTKSSESLSNPDVLRSLQPPECAFKIETVPSVKIYTRTEKISIAFFYAVSSILIMFANKVVLTEFQFPSSNVLALYQFMFTVVMLWILRYAGVIDFPLLSLTAMLKKTFPLPFLFLANTLLGLGGTRALSMPMFSVLRRFSILFAMVLEMIILKKYHSTNVKISVFMMIAGAIVAAIGDLSFDMQGYIIVLLNDVTSALTIVVMKKKMDAKELGLFGLLYYNTLVSGVLTAVLLMTYNSGDFSDCNNIVYNEIQAANIPFITSIFGSLVLGIVVNLSLYHCTNVNSPLTASVIGCLKNMLTTYAGMLVGSDYIYSPMNFSGVTISVVGSLFYSYYTFGGSPQKSREIEGKTAVK